MHTTLLLLAALSLFSTSDGHAELKPCAQILKSDWVSWIQKNRTELVKAYHLPQDYLLNYYHRRIEPGLAKPQYEALQAVPNRLFRGMFLTPETLMQILNEGFLSSKIKWNAGGTGVSFSSNIQEASSYIFQAATDKKDGIGVVFEVEVDANHANPFTLLDDARLNSTRTIFHSQQDVAAQKITNVYLWGQWGLESLNSVAKTLLTPGKTLIPHEEWTGVFSSHKLN